MLAAGALLAGAGLLGAAAPASAAATVPFLYVANGIGNNVTAYNLSTNTTAATIPAGTQPQGVAASADGSTVYVANAIGGISVIDTGSKAARSRWPSPTCRRRPRWSPGSARQAARSPAGPRSRSPAATSPTPPRSASAAPRRPRSRPTAIRPSRLSAPRQPASDPVDVTVTTPNGTSAPSAADQFSYVYPFSGFFAPVDNLPTVNMANAGQAIPLQFGLGGDFGLNIVAPGFPTATQIACATGVPLNSGTLTDTAGGSGLQFSSASDTYTYVWKTSKAWADTCQQLDLRLNDGTDHIADFKFK